MTEDRESKNNVGEGDGSDNSMESYFQLHDDLLRRLGYRFERTKLVEQSVERIRAPTPQGYSMLHEAEICLAAYHIVWQYATRRPGKSGLRGVELGNLMRCVIYLGYVLEDDLALVRHLDEHLDLADLGVEHGPKRARRWKENHWAKGPSTEHVANLRRRLAPPTVPRVGRRHTVSTCGFSGAA